MEQETPTGFKAVPLHEVERLKAILVDEVEYLGALIRAGEATKQEKRDYMDVQGQLLEWTLYGRELTKQKQE